MKQKYITPASQSVSLHVEAPLLSNSFEISTAKQSDAVMSNEQQWNGGGIWSTNDDNE